LADRVGAGGKKQFPRLRQAIHVANDLASLEMTEFFSE